MYSGVNFPI